MTVVTENLMFLSKFIHAIQLIRYCCILFAVLLFKGTSAKQHIFFIGIFIVFINFDIPSVMFALEYPVQISSVLNH